MRNNLYNSFIQTSEMELTKKIFAPIIQVFNVFLFYHQQSLIKSIVL